MALSAFDHAKELIAIAEMGVDPMISQFNEHIAARMREIPELSPERLDTLLHSGNIEALE